MHKHLRSIFTTIAIFCLSASALADPVAEVFTCKLHEGKTMEDAKAVNKIWLAWMQAKVAEEITSAAVESGFDAAMKCPSNRLWKLQRAD